MHIKRDSIILIICCAIIYLISHYWVDVIIGACLYIIGCCLKYLFILHLIEQTQHKEQTSIDEYDDE